MAALAAARGTAAVVGAACHRATPSCGTGALGVPAPGLRVTLRAGVMGTIRAAVGVCRVG